jgi:hypothetical protein
VSFAAITLCVESQLVYVVYFVIGSVRKLLFTSSYFATDSLGLITSFQLLIDNYKMMSSGVFSDGMTGLSCNGYSSELRCN